MVAEPLRLVLAEDHYLVREGTRRLLDDADGIEVLAAVGSATELLEAVAELLRAARETIAGRSVIDPLIVDALIAHRVRLTSSPLSTLSPRELDVLRQMAEGATNPRIAASLHVSESAVSKHVGAIFAKLSLAEDDQSDRRVRAVLTFLHEAGRDKPLRPA